MDVRQLVPQRALTHAGIFHADDVFSAALLRILNPSVEIIRANAVPQAFDGLVFDIGGGEFDHHSGQLRYRDNGVPFSSLGLLWERFATLLVHPDDARIIDEGLVQPIDLTDNTGRPNPLSQCVSDFNPIASTDPSAFDEAFSSAVVFAKGILERRIASIRAEREDTDEVERLMAQGDGLVLALPRAMRWKRTVIGSSYLFVVYPSLRGDFIIQCVPKQSGSVETVTSPPQAWWGLSGDDLKHVSDNPHLTFCHKTGFLMVADTLDGALAVARELATKATNGDGNDA